MDFNQDKWTKADKSKLLKNRFKQNYTAHILDLHIQTALNDIIGFLGSLKSHKCVNVSIEQLARRCGFFECQSMSVTTRV